MSKSTTCYSKEGNPLTEFRTLEDAQQCASYEKKVRNKDLIPYKCSKCYLYHLAPADSVVDVRKAVCSCQDSHGRSKDLYMTYDDALKVKQLRESRGSEELFIYECPECFGFHLSHKHFI